MKKEPLYPRIRYRGLRPGSIRPRRRELLARDVFRIAFYLPHDHPEIASGVSHAVESYLRAVGQGPKTIHRAIINDDEGDDLTEERWSHLHRLLLPERPFRFIDELSEATAHRMEKWGYATQLLFDGGFCSVNGYELCYRARIPWRTPSHQVVSLLTATLPTEYLELHGPAHVRELSLEMASQLRFATGHAGLALCLYWPLRSGDVAFRAELSRYPGIDLRPTWLDIHRMGTRVDGIHWLNFLGPPVLGQLGGVAALRARLQDSATTVHALDSERVAVSLGEAPDAGDVTAGRDLPAYRELAQVLAPWLEPPASYPGLRFTEDETKRWWRRFLDGAQHPPSGGPSSS